MQDVVARLRAAPAVITNTANIRRDHRTVISRDEAPTVHVIEGDATATATTRDCFRNWELEFTIAVFVRADAGYAAAEPIMIRIMAALDPSVAYPGSADLIPNSIRKEQEIADADALRVDMRFVFKYRTALWAL